jgi:sec-independent protein translocase protein TatC
MSETTPSPQSAEKSQGAEPEEPSRMSFGAHLDELRKRLFKAIGVIAVMFLGGWSFFANQLTWVFMQPHNRAVQGLLEADPPIEINPKLIVLNPLEDLFFQLKASLMVSLLLGFPYLIWQIWCFVSVGLHDHERKPLRKFLPWSMVLALVGMAFCYFIFFPTILEFLYGRLNTDYFEDGYRLKDYFGLYLMFTFALALIFQLPMLLAALGAAGVVDAKILRKYRRHFILGAFIIGAMLTPPEPFSQFMMAVPTILLFEFGVLLVAFQDRRRRIKGKSA